MISKNHKGLSEEQVLKSRETYGSNEISRKEPKTFMQSFWETFIGDAMIRILTIALIIEVIFHFLGYVELFEPVGIGMAVLLATLIGTWSEFSSESKFQDLQEKASAIRCKVFRDGNIKEIFIGEIVSGDLILLQSGDKVPVDGILLEGELQVNLAALNGETEPCKKSIAPTEFDFDSAKYDEENSPFLNPYKLFRDSVVSEGEAVVKAIKVGENTFVGKKYEDEEEEILTPLKEKLERLGKGISIFGTIGGICIALAFFFTRSIMYPTLMNGSITYFSSSNVGQILADLVQSVILAVIIIVVAVPEGLPMMVAMVLSLNMKKLLKDNILVRQLVGIETAGSLQILFSDKTGTLTKGQLEVINFFNGENKEYRSYNEMNVKFKKLVDLAITFNTSSVCEEYETENGISKLKVFGGNPTDRALLEYANNEILEHNSEIVSKITFNSTIKYSASQISGSHNMTLLKGAPDVILPHCKYYYDENGNVNPLSEKMIKEINERINSLANNAIRVVTLATTNNDIVGNTVNLEESTFIGILGIRDDLRETTKSSIEQMHKAGVQVVMITGDRKETALAIAKEAGLITKPEHKVYTSKELNEMSDQEIKNEMFNIRVISRALPSDKRRLVKLAQELNLVTGMTGDGVNDAPALEKADVGFAMGSGTEVAKESSKIVILDDDISSISKTILYGRTIYNSIQKFIIYQMTVNVAAIATAFIGPFLGVDLPLSMTQMLWINLVMDTLAALAFGGEPALSKYMNEKPKNRTDNIVTKKMWSAILINGGYIAILCVLFMKTTWFASFFRGMPEGMTFATALNNPNAGLEATKYMSTAFFTFFIFMNGFNLFNARVTSCNLFEHITENKGFLRIATIIFTVQVIMTYLGGEVLRTYGLSISELLFVIALSITIIPIDLIRKKIVTQLF